MIELSFVIPAYNVEKYIERCLNSIFSQDVDESRYEVIVVDDGSTDGTIRLVNKMQESHNNLQVVSQGNSGPSVARNKGIELSKGEYIWFVDSDDYVVDDSINKLLGLIVEKKPVILYFTIDVKYLNGTIENCFKQSVTKEVIISGKRAINEGFYPTSACLALWNREYIECKSIRFNSKIKYGEDALFSFMALAQAQNVLFVDDAYYFYDTRQGSLIRNKGAEKRIEQKISDIEVVKSLNLLASKYEKCDVELFTLISKHAKKILFGLVYSLLKEEDAIVKTTVIKKLKKERLYPLKGPFYSWKKRIISFLLNIEPLFYFFNLHKHCIVVSK